MENNNTNRNDFYRTRNKEINKDKFYIKFLEGIANESLDRKDAFKNSCKEFDIYFTECLFDTIATNTAQTREICNEYFRKLNLNQYVGKDHFED